MLVLGFAMGVGAAFVALALANAFAPDEVTLPHDEQPSHVHVVPGRPYDWARDN